MELVRLGPLQAIVTPELPDAEVERHVVLLHGFGAPGTDLVGLAPQLHGRAGTRFVFLQAPHLLEGMSGPHAGRAWWHIDMMALQVARMLQQDDQLAAAHPEGLDEARAALEQALDALEEQHGAVPEKTFVGGFSQGAMLTCDWALRSSRPLAGLIQLSGTVLCEDDWKKLFPARKGLRVFQSHSPEDQVLPYSLAERLAGLFRGAGCDHRFVSFRGGHGIGPEVLTGLRDFLS